MECNSGFLASGFCLDKRMTLVNNKVQGRSWLSFTAK